MKVTIENINGTKYIVADGKPIDTLSFKSFRPTKNNVGDFYKAGVKLQQVYVSGLYSRLEIPYSAYGETWFGEGDYRFDGFDRQMEMVIETAPDAYIMVNLHIDAREWWHEQNPGRPDTYSYISQTVADEKWRKDTADYIKAFMAHAEEKYGDKIVSYFLLAGVGTEWLSMYDWQETHPIKLKAYKEYMNDETIEIPTRERLEETPENQIFLDPIKDKDIIDYQKFHADLMVDTILYYAREAHTILNHNKLLGVYFGYIMESPYVWTYGHLAFDKLYRSGEFGMLATPSSYKFREYNDSSAPMLITDTVDINNLVYFTSFDHMTFLTPTLYNHPRRICEDKDDERGLPALIKLRTDLNNLSTREKTIHAIQREYMSKASKRMGMWWFDMLEGWYYDDELMESIEDIVKKSEKLMGKERSSNSEIAVLVSAESLYYVNKMSRINAEYINKQRDPLSRMGAPFDLFSFNDLERLDKDKYKLIIFLDAFYMTDREREYINNQIKKDGRSVLFIGSADYINDDGVSKERMENMIGMKLDLADTEETKIGGMDTLYGHEKAQSPIWYVSDADAKNLGRYNVSRKCGLARKKFKDYTSYFSGLGNISAKVLREIAREAGVHIYVENDTSTYINSRVYGVYNTKSEFTTITLKEDGEFVEFFSGKRYKSENKTVTLPTGENPAQMLVLED